MTCAGPDGDQGCGLACALLFRDDWLEPAAAPQQPGRPDAPAATIRSLAEIQATLDAHGTLDGVPFHPAMADYAGTRHTEPIAVEHHALPGWIRPSGEQWYLFDSLRCNGEPVEGGCDRRCALLWHKSWLNLDDANTPAAPSPQPPTPPPSPAKSQLTALLKPTLSPSPHLLWHTDPRASSTSP